MRTRLVLLAFAALACSKRPAAEPAPVPAPARAQPAEKRPAATATRSLVGSYRFTAVNKNKVPAEFPAGSGARLESGSLDLLANNRFAMQFRARAKGADDARNSGEAGRYRIGGDTLYFHVDGRDAQPPVVFRYARTSDGLRLIDSKGNTWAYARK